MLTLEKVRAAIRRFRRDRRGGVFVLVAISLLAFMGAAALAVDLGSAYTLQARLQNVADAAALASAKDLPDFAQVSTKAQEYAIKNIGTRFGQVVDADNVAIGNWDTSARTFTDGANPTNAVQVTAQMTQENGNPASTFFGSIFGIESMDISATAIATGGSNRCVFVLDTSTRGALSLSGNATVELDCGVIVNSRSASAFENKGSNACLEAPSIEVVGGYSSPSDNCGNPPDTGVVGPADPLSNLAPPAWWECDYGVTNIDSEATMYPGTYCDSVTIGSGANVTMEPGEYLFWGVPFHISGGATVDGDGVTIYFTEGGGANGVLSISGGATVTLKAPATGPRQSVVFYSDRNATRNVTHNFTGGVTMDLTGIIYAPNQGLKFAGGAELTGSCVTIIARELEFVGNTEISTTNTCPDELSNVMSKLRLVQ